MGVFWLVSVSVGSKRIDNARVRYLTLAKPTNVPFFITSSVRYFFVFDFFTPIFIFLVNFCVEWVISFYRTLLPV